MISTKKKKANDVNLSGPQFIPSYFTCDATKDLAQKGPIYVAYFLDTVNATNQTGNILIFKTQILHTIKKNTIHL